jgi:NTE family protein
MPFATEPVEKGVALALSGGGFRATLFHLGSLWPLNELGYLPKLDRVSSVSGGSITAGVLGLHWNQLNFVNQVATNFKEVIVSPLSDLYSKNIDAPAIGERALLPWKSVSGAIQEEYRVCDNMGLETVWNRYDTVLVSDAGAPMKIGGDVETLWHLPSFSKG